MGLDSLLGEEETLADVAIHEAVRDQLQNLDLARRRLLLELAGRRRERNDFRAAAASNRREWSMYLLRMRFRSAASTKWLSTLYLALFTPL